METIRKQDGFEREMLFVLPEYWQTELARFELTRQLYVSDIGYFPRAQHHYRERAGGSDAHIFILCADGEGWIELPDNRAKIPLSPRQLYVIPAGTPHRYGASPLDPWSIYWFHLKGSHVSEMIELYQLAGSPLPIPVSVYARFMETFSQSYDQLTDKTYSAAVHAHVSQTMRHLLSGIGIGAGKSAQDKKRESYLEHAVRYMAEHVADSVKLPDLARHTGLSRQHLIYLFNRETGQPPIEYFLRMKMQRAAQLLDLTDLTVKQVGHAVGLSDPYYFSRLFKRMMGHSPSQYRQIPKG